MLAWHPVLKLCNDPDAAVLEDDGYSALAATTSPGKGCREGSHDRLEVVLKSASDLEMPSAAYSLAWRGKTECLTDQIAKEHG